MPQAKIFVGEPMRSTIARNAVGKKAMSIVEVRVGQEDPRRREGWCEIAQLSEDQMDGKTAEEVKAMWHEEISRAAAVAVKRWLVGAQ